MEDVLIKSSSFKLPGKKKLWESEAEPKVIVIDVTESSNAPGRRIRPATLTKIERPKKNRSDAIQEKKEIIH